MKKIKIKEPIQKKTLFGIKTVVKEKTIKVDNKTYRKMKRQKEDEEFDKLAFLAEVLWDD